MRPIAAAQPETRPGEGDSRFAFGSNWQRFLSLLDEERIVEAERSLKAMLEIEDLAGKSFLDVGCGSGLFSLAAMRLGASKVCSFDYDPQSVSCGQTLKQRYFPEADHWRLLQGSVLDADFLSRLGEYDVVYAWGVLHHTGDMWQALENVIVPVAADGKLFLALYNDQGVRSRWWKTIKKAYNRNRIWRGIIISVFVPFYITRGFIKDLITLKAPTQRYREYKKSRGMSYLTDWLDWLGGYPFEVAKPEMIVEFFQRKGFETSKLKTAGRGLGNNEYVVHRCPRQGPS
ncbi:MAG TPA: class I SAM-dependent methyltransferase [Candidatus Angelobacter sp.]|nr:class I SAM-dependent methyltransferase [Candidatus Angelobacter sp.]